MPLAWQPKINRLWSQIEEEERKIEELSQPLAPRQRFGAGLAAPEEELPIEPEEGWYSRIMRYAPWTVVGTDIRTSIRATEIAEETGRPRQEVYRELLGLPPIEEVKELPWYQKPTAGWAPTPEVYEEFQSLPWQKQLLYEAPFWGMQAIVPGAMQVRAALAPTAARGGIRGAAAAVTRGALRPVAAIEEAQAKIIQAVANKISATRINFAFHRSAEYKQLIKEMPNASKARTAIEQRLRSAFLYDLQGNTRTATNIRTQIYHSKPQIDPGFHMPVPEDMALMLWVGGSEALLPMNPQKWAMLNIQGKVNLVKSLGLPGSVASKAWGALTEAERGVLGAKPEIPEFELFRTTRGFEEDAALRTLLETEQGYKLYAVFKTPTDAQEAAIKLTGQDIRFVKHISTTGVETYEVYTKPLEIAPEAVRPPTEGIKPEVSGIVTPIPGKEASRLKETPIWARTQVEVLVDAGGLTLDEKGRSLIRRNHKEIIKQALSEGKPVPNNVLKDYPDLAPPTEVKPAVPEVTPEVIVPKAPAPPEVLTPPPVEAPLPKPVTPSLELSQPKRAIELIRGVVEKWESLNIPRRVELFKSLGISGKLAPREWDALPITTKAKLADSLTPPPPNAPPEAVVPITRGESIQPASVNLTKQQATENVRMAVYNAIPESELDVAATSFLHENNFDTYIANMPLYKKLTPEEAQKMGIALRKTPKGKEVPAMRKSGFYVTKEFADYPYFENVGQVSGHWMDTTSMFSAIDGGYQGGAVAKYILHPTRQTHIAALEWNESEKLRIFNEVFAANDLVGKKYQIRAVSYVAEHITQSEARAGLISELLEKPRIKQFVARYSEVVRKRIVKAAVETRRAFDRLITMENQVRIKRGQDTIPYRENYIPWVMDTNVWSRTFGLRKKPEGVMAVPQMADFIKPDKPWNPREQARLGGLAKYHKERNMMTLLYDYVDTAMKDIFYTNIVQNAKIHSQTLRSLGHKSSAALIEDWAAESYAGVTSGVSRGIRRVIPMGALRPLFMLRRLLNTAVFAFNWQWNLFIQTSSTALTTARYGVKNTMMGMEYLINPKVKEQVRKNAYSWIIKARRGGKMVYQDLGASLEKSNKLETSRLQKAEQVALYLTSTIEEKLTGLSVWAAYKDGLDKGMREGSRELWDYASDGGALTQSMYNREDLPGVLRAREVGAFAPFQTFAIQVFNLSRELIGIPKIPRAGAYRGIAAKEVKPGAEPLRSRRIKRLMQGIAAIVVINVVTDKAINRKPWVVSSFIPMWSLLMGGTNAGNPWNQPLPTRYVGEFWRGVTAALKYDNYTKLRNWALKYHSTGGAQITKTLDGIEAVAKGKKEDVSGRTMFRISRDPINVAMAYSMGVYATREGRAYIHKQEEEMGGLPYELTRIPMSFLYKKKTYKIPSVPERPTEPVSDSQMQDRLRQELGSIEDIRELLRQELGR